MKKHLHYLCAALFAVAAFPVAAQTEADPLVIEPGKTLTIDEDDVPEGQGSTVYFTFTPAETGFATIMGVTSYSYQNTFSAKTADGTTFKPSFLGANQTIDGEPVPCLKFLAEEGVTYYIEYTKVMFQNWPYKVTCELTPYDGGMGKTCDDAIDLNAGSDIFFPYSTTGEELYAKYTADSNVRLIVSFYNSLQYLYVGESCDDISDELDPKSNYDATYQIILDEGETVYFKTKGTDFNPATVTVEEVIPGASCKDAWELKDGANVIPAAAGTYWFSITNPTNEDRVLVISSDAVATAEIFASCDYINRTGTVYDSLNFRSEIISGKSSRVMKIVKEEATAAAEEFEAEFAELEPIEDIHKGQPITEGEEVTTPGAGTFYYSITAPEGDTKIISLTSDVDTSKLSYPSYTVFTLTDPENPNGYYTRFATGTKDFKVEDKPGQTYLIIVNATYGEITFAVEFENIEDGSLETYPIEVEELGDVEIPEFSPVYYTFLPDEVYKLSISTDIADATITCKYDQYGSYPTRPDYWTSVTLNKGEDGSVWMKTEANKTYMFIVTKPAEKAEKAGTITFADLGFGPGETLKTAIKEEAGDITLPDGPSDVWYQFVAPVSGYMTCTSTMSFNAQNVFAAYVGSADAKAVHCSTNFNYSTFKSEYTELKTLVEKDQVVYLNMKNVLTQEAPTLTVSFSETGPGETYATAIPIEYNNGATVEIEKNIPTDSKKGVWYVIDNLPAGNLRATSPDKITVALYSADDTSKVLASGNTNGNEGYYGILKQIISTAGKYYLYVYNTEDSADPTSKLTLTITMSELLPGESFETPYIVDGPTTVAIPALVYNTPTPFWIQINAKSTGNLNIEGEYGMGNLYAEGDLTKPIAEYKSISSQIYGIKNVIVNEGVYYLKLTYTYKMNMVFSGSALNKTVNVNVDVMDGESFAYTTPANSYTSFNLDLPEGWVVESVTANDKDVAVAETYGFLTGEEDINYVFTVAYDGDLDVADELTGIDSVDDTNVSVNIVDGKVEISNLTVGDNIAVYSLGGLLVTTHTASSDGITLSLEKGTYVILINKSAVKVIL